MATTTNFTCNKDARVAQSGSTEMGSGTSTGLPYGTYSGYKYRSFLGFSINMAGWTSITIAELHYKSSNQIHVAFGSDPTFVVWPEYRQRRHLSGPINVRHERRAGRCAHR
jgi:hypothetical protein